MPVSIFDSPEFNQNLFFPRPDSGSRASDAEDLMIQVAPGIKVHVRQHRFPLADFSLLYFHGNGEIVADYDDLASSFMELNGEFLVADYRGYGKSTGYPTLRSALEDAGRIYQALKEAGRLHPKICVMGRSLGSASAIELCARFPEINACIIESGYADPIPLVERRGLRIERTTPEEDALFNNSRKIARVQCPLLIMHGAEDVLISPREAQLNYEQAGSKMKSLRILEGVGHNDILFAPGNAYFKTLKSFLEAALNP